MDKELRDSFLATYCDQSFIGNLDTKQGNNVTVLEDYKRPENSTELDMDEWSPTKRAVMSPIIDMEFCAEFLEGKAGIFLNIESGERYNRNPMPKENKKFLVINHLATWKDFAKGVESLSGENASVFNDLYASIASPHVINFLKTAKFNEKKWEIPNKDKSNIDARANAFAESVKAVTKSVHEIC